MRKQQDRRAEREHLNQYLGADKEDEPMYKFYSPDSTVVIHCPKGHKLWFPQGISLKNLNKKYNITLRTSQIPGNAHQFISSNGGYKNKARFYHVCLTDIQMTQLTRKSGKKCRDCNKVPMSGTEDTICEIETK